MRGLRTRYGTLDLEADERGARIGGDLRVPPGGIVVELPGFEGTVVREVPAVVGKDPGAD